MSFLWLLEREREYYEKCITFSLLLQSNMLFVIFITKFLPNFHSLSIFKSSKMPSIEFHEFKSSNSNQVNKLPKKKWWEYTSYETNMTSGQCGFLVLLLLLLSIARSSIAFSLFYAQFSCAHDFLCTLFTHIAYFSLSVFVNKLFHMKNLPELCRLNDILQSDWSSFFSHRNRRRSGSHLQ